MLMFTNFTYIKQNYKPRRETRKIMAYSFLDCFSLSSVGSGKSLTVACHVMLARNVVVFIFISGFFSSDSGDFLSAPVLSPSFALSISSGLASYTTLGNNNNNQPALTLFKNCKILFE